MLVPDSGPRRTESENNPGEVVSKELRLVTVPFPAVTVTFGLTEAIGKPAASVTRKRMASRCRELREALAMEPKSVMRAGVVEATPY